MKKFLVVLMALLFAGSAFAQDAPSKKFDPYASIRLLLGVHNMDLPEGSTNADKEADMVYRLQSNSRFGAKMENGDLKGHVELGLSASGVSMRLAYATYDAGFAQLMVGHNFTPYTWTATGDYFDDNNLTGFGVSYDGRKPYIKVSSNGFYIAFIEPSRVTTGINGGKTTYAIKQSDGTIGSSTSVADTTVFMPKTAIGFDYSFDGSVVGLGGAMNMVKINDAGCTADKEKIISYVGYFHANIVMGAFTLRGNAAYGQNFGNFGMLDVAAGNSDTLQSTGGVNSLSVAYINPTNTEKLKNSKNAEGYINPMFKVTPDFMIGAGYGYAQIKRDDFDKTDKQQAYFIDAKINVASNFALFPEFSYRDFMKDKNGDKQGNEFYAGMQIQMNL